MSLTFSDYHEAIKPTKLPAFPSFGDNLVYPALGANDEAGELAGKVKKLWRDHGITHASQLTDYPDVQKLRSGILKEIGDVLWYLDAMAEVIGSSLEECAKLNVEKLLSRLERGTTGGSGDDR